MRSLRHIVMGVVLDIILTLVMQMSISHYLKPTVRPVLQDIQYVNYIVSPFALEMQLPRRILFAE